MSHARAVNILEYTNSGLTSSISSGSSVDPTAKNMNVKVIGKTNSSHMGSRSIGDFTKLTDRFQSGISVSHKHAPESKNMLFKEKKEKKSRKKQGKSQKLETTYQTSVRKTTHTTNK